MSCCKTTATRSTVSNADIVCSFDNSEDLKNGLDENWPNNFPVSIPTFDCNMIAMKADWLVMKWEEELAALLA